MERTSSSPTKKDKEGRLSCWGRFKLKLPWNKRRSNYISCSSTNSTRRGNSSTMQYGCNIIEALTRSGKRQARPAGGFRYDPLSYAQNFDDGCWDDDSEVGFSRGFSSRFAVSSSSSRPINEGK